MGLIFALSAQPGVPGLMPEIPGLDKAAHALEYAVLGLLLARAFGGGWRRVLAAVAVAALYGLTDEWHQSFVPGREATLGDWAADWAGALAGAISTARRPVDTEGSR